MGLTKRRKHRYRIHFQVRGVSHMNITIAEVNDAKFYDSMSFSESFLSIPVCILQFSLV